MKHAGLCILVMSLLPAWPARAEVIVRLRPAPADGPTDEGFLPAILTVADPNGELPEAIGAVSLRRTRGGPTLLYAVSLAPRTEHQVPVSLPVVSVQEAYRVRLLAGADGTGGVLRERQIPLTLPDLGLVDRARGALIQPTAYDNWKEDLPRWPRWLLRTVFLTMALFCVALGAALFVRRPALRLWAVLLVAAAATAATAWLLSQCPAVSLRRSGPLTIVACRRTTTWSHPAVGVRPLYWSRHQMDADDMLYRPGSSLTLTLRPQQVRLFRRAAGPTTTATAPAR